MRRFWKKGPGRPATDRPRLEALEDRTLPSLTGSEFLVGPSANTQHESANASSDDASVVVWTEGDDIKAQRFDRIGNRVGGPITVANTSLREFDPAVAMDDRGNFVVTWTEQPSGFGSIVRAARFRADGTQEGSTFAVETLRSSRQSSVGMDRQGNFVVSYTTSVYVSDRAGYDQQVWAKLFYASGTLAREIVVDRQSFLDVHTSSLACAADGQFAVAVEVGDRNGVRLKRFTAAGDLQATEGTVFFPASSALLVHDPSVSMNDFGDCVVAFVATTPGTGQADVLVRQVTSYGLVQPDVLIDTNRTLDPMPAVALDSRNNNFVVAHIQDTGWLDVTEVTLNGVATTADDEPYQGVGFGHDDYWVPPAISVSGEHRFLVTATAGYDHVIAGRFGQLGDLPGSPVFLDLTQKVLTVNGTPGRDTVTISNATTNLFSDDFVVTLNNQSFPLHWSDLRDRYSSGRIEVATFGDTDVVNVENVSQGVVVTIDVGDGDDTVNLSPGAGRLSSFYGGLQLDGGTGTDSLRAYDWYNVGYGNRYDLANGRLTIGGLPEMAVNYGDFAHVALWTANGTTTHANTVTVGPEAAGSSLIVHGGSLTDRLVLDFSGGNPIPTGGVEFLGSGGNNTLDLVGNRCRYETVTLFGPTYYSGYVSLQDTLSSPARSVGFTNVYVVRDAGVAPAPGSLPTYLTVNGSSAVDGISVHDGPLVNGFQTTQVVLGTALNFANRNEVTVNGLAQNDHLTVNNPRPAAGLRSLTVDGGSGNDLVTMFAAGVPVTIRDVAGTNTLAGPNAPNWWAITGGGAGTLNGNVTFSGMANLTGGWYADTFAFSSTGSLAGTLDGGGGGDTLDYFAYTADVRVNLALGTATGVRGRVVGIANATGGRANNLFVGDAGINVFLGGRGANLMIGGRGADQLFGGLRESILIGGYTNFDTNPTVLNALFAEWKRTDRSVTQRIYDLTHANAPGSYNGASLLVPATVRADGFLNVDVLRPGAGMAWVFYDALDDVPAVRRSQDRYRLV